MSRLIVATIVSAQLICQVAMQLLVVRLAGVCQATDTYLAAQAVPLAVAAVLVSALQSAWLPRFSDFTDGAQWTEQIASAQAQAILLSGGVALAIGLIAPLWLPFLYPSFSSTQYSQAFLYTALLLLGLILTTNSSVLLVALRVRGQHITAELAALAGALVAVIATYFAVAEFGILGAVVVQVLRTGLLVALQLWLLDWPRPAWMAGLRDRETWRLMRPLILSGGVFKFGPVIDRFIAGLTPTGTLTIFVLAQTLVLPLVTLLEQVICVPALTRISRSIRSGYNRHPARLFLGELIQIIILVGIVAILGLLVFSYGVNIVQVVLKLDNDSAHLLLVCSLVFLAFVASTAAGRLVTATFYAGGDSRSTALVGIVNFVFSVAAKLLLFQHMGIVGLAAGVAAFPCLNVAVLLLLQSRHHAKKKN